MTIGVGLTRSPLAPGDTLTIQKGPYTFEITVERISKQRRPAEEARALYTESEDSAQERHAVYRQRKLEGHSARDRAGPPGIPVRGRLTTVLDACIYLELNCTGDSILGIGWCRSG